MDVVRDIDLRLALKLRRKRQRRKAREIQREALAHAIQGGGQGRAEFQRPRRSKSAPRRQDSEVRTRSSGRKDLGKQPLSVRFPHRAVAKQSRDDIIVANVMDVELPDPRLGPSASKLQPPDPDMLKFDRELQPGLSAAVSSISAALDSPPAHVFQEEFKAVGHRRGRSSIDVVDEDSFASIARCLPADLDSEIPRDISLPQESPDSVGPAEEKNRRLLVQPRSSSAMGHVPKDPVSENQSAASFSDEQSKGRRYPNPPRGNRGRRSRGRRRSRSRRGRSRSRAASRQRKRGGSRNRSRGRRVRGAGRRAPAEEEEESRPPNWPERIWSSLTGILGCNRGRGAGGAGSPPLKPQGYPTSFKKQLQLLLRRDFILQKRSRMLWLFQFTQIILLALLICLSYAPLSDDQTSIVNRLVSFVLLTLIRSAQISV